MSAFGWVVRTVLMSGSSTGLMPPPRAEPNRLRRRLTPAWPLPDPFPDGHSAMAGGEGAGAAEVPDAGSLAGGPATVPDAGSPAAEPRVPPGAPAGGGTPMPTSGRS